MQSSLDVKQWQVMSTMEGNRLKNKIVRRGRIEKYTKKEQHEEVEWRKTLKQNNPTRSIREELLVLLLLLLLLRLMLLVLLPFVLLLYTTRLQPLSRDCYQHCELQISSAAVRLACIEAILWLHIRVRAYPPGPSAQENRYIGECEHPYAVRYYITPAMPGYQTALGKAVGP